MILSKKVFLVPSCQDQCFWQGKLAFIAWLFFVPRLKSRPVKQSFLAGQLLALANLWQQYYKLFCGLYKNAGLAFIATVPRTTTTADSYFKNKHNFYIKRLLIRVNGKPVNNFLPYFWSWWIIKSWNLCLAKKCGLCCCWLLYSPQFSGRLRDELLKNLHWQNNNGCLRL